MGQNEALPVRALNSDFWRAADDHITTDYTTVSNLNASTHARSPAASAAYVFRFTVQIEALPVRALNTKFWRAADDHVTTDYTTISDLNAIICFYRVLWSVFRVCGQTYTITFIYCGFVNASRQFG